MLKPRLKLLTLPVDGTLVDGETVNRDDLAEVLARKGTAVDPGPFSGHWYEGARHTVVRLRAADLRPLPEQLGRR